MLTVRPQVLPGYFVSARHGSLVPSATGKALWQPFGVHHARRVGEPTAACGLTAIDWTIFWEIPFPREPAETCAACFAAVVRMEEQSRRSSGWGEEVR